MQVTAPDAAALSRAWLCRSLNGRQRRPSGRARAAEVHALLSRGLTITEISRTLRLERKTVRRYAIAATAGQRIGGARLSRPVGFQNRS
jgi:hypothetical protein